MLLSQLLEYCNPAITINLKINNKIVYSGYKIYINNRYLQLEIEEFEVENDMLIVYIVKGD